MAISFKGAHFPKEIILMGVRWYVAYPLSTRHVEELMEERGVELDHATINRWVIKYSPLLEDALHRRKRPVWVSWRMDETYIRVKGEWRYLYRAVDKSGQTIDVLLTKGFCRKLCSGGAEGAVAPVREGIMRPGRRTVRPQWGTEHDSCKILAHWLLMTPRGPQNPESPYQTWWFRPKHGPDTRSVTNRALQINQCLA
jgi:hypothetical protein